MNALSWPWIGLELTAVPIAALLAAYPLWRRMDVILGNVAGTAIIFAAGFGLIWREYIVIDGVVRQCFADGTVCWPEPSAFTRFAVYAFIALFEVFALFAVSLKAEERRRSRDYDPQWR